VPPTGARGSARGRALTTAPFRCAAAALARGDDVAGSATHVNGFVLIEHDGPWGEAALRDARLPDAVKEHLSHHRGLKVLLVRRHHRAHREPGCRVFVCFPRRRLLLTTHYAGHDDLLGLDLAAVVRGEEPAGAWETVTEPLYAVCTHGRHDACCAEQGRPVAAALAAARPSQSWEVSHIGGDRFAANLLVLPEGLYYGRVTPDDVAGLADLHDQGRLDLPRLRGRASRAMALQYAEIALRRHLDDDRRDALRLTRRDELTTEWEHPSTGTVWRVRVARTLTDPAQLTCSAARPNPVPVFTAEEISRLG
jgi:hypothetical protein